MMHEPNSFIIAISAIFSKILIMCYLLSQSHPSSTICNRPKSLFQTAHIAVMLCSSFSTLHESKIFATGISFKLAFTEGTAADSIQLDQLQSWNWAQTDPMGFKPARNQAKLRASSKQIKSKIDQTRLRSNNRDYSIFKLSSDFSLDQPGPTRT